MAIEFACNQCLQPLRVPDTSAGKSARCPKCQALTPVPAVTTMPMPLAAPPAASVAPPPAAPAAPPPPKGPNDDLFAMLKAATTPQPVGPPPPSFVPASPFPATNPEAGGYPYGSAPPAVPLPGNPFGDLANPSAGPAASPDPANLNPYASPLSAAYGYDPAGIAPGKRSGLPWETQGASFRSWWKTAQMCLSEPSHAFRLMWQEGGVGSPMLFAVCGMGLGFLGQTVWRLPVLLFTANAGGAVQQDLLVEGLIEIGVGALGTLAGATLGLFIYAAIYHAFLLLLGGATRGYETTYRVVAFVHGSIAWLNVIPCVGPLIILVMFFVCLINGLKQAQETTGGKAAAAVFLPIVACVAVAVGIGFTIALAMK